MDFRALRPCFTFLSSSDFMVIMVYIVSSGFGRALRSARGKDGESLLGERRHEVRGAG